MMGARVELAAVPAFVAFAASQPKKVGRVLRPWLMKVLGLGMTGTATWLNCALFWYRRLVSCIAEPLGQSLASAELSIASCEDSPYGQRACAFLHVQSWSPLTIMSRPRAGWSRGIKGRF